MSCFIYLVVLKCTGRTCNAHLVIGGDVIASSWYVYISVSLYIYFNSFPICIFSYIYFLRFFSVFLVNIHENHPTSVFVRFFLPRGSFSFTSPGMRRGARDHFGTIL